jgi:hypothetical protein
MIGATEHVIEVVFGPGIANSTQERVLRAITSVLAEESKGGRVSARLR